ncbi:hypothetical protein DdX_17049 [Ditylenchus destructor]|uniref:Uncharacterized protein n=1 Tax=Ditylenchus destructor TaxID=166010 RepID=A0AAD4MN04_9BILA|nr:hypothetical protein DdX_17049 [Ditylenchus destructor]
MIMTIKQQVSSLAQVHVQNPKSPTCLSHAAVFGGESNPCKVEQEYKAGNVNIIPVDVAHYLLYDYGSGYKTVGSYSVGATHWICVGEEAKVNNIKLTG